MSERADRLAIGAGLVTVVLWSSAFVGIRAVVADYSPGSIALGRLLVGRTRRSAGADAQPSAATAQDPAADADASGSPASIR